jgi:hypothetical protein
LKKTYVGKRLPVGVLLWAPERVVEAEKASAEPKGR